MQERRHLPAGGQWRLHLSVSSRLPWQELPAKGRTLSPKQVSYFLTPSTLHPAGSIPNFFHQHLNLLLYHLLHFPLLHHHHLLHLLFNHLLPFALSDLRV